jgi:hypothetical protein
MLLLLCLRARVCAATSTPGDEAGAGELRKDLLKAKAKFMAAAQRAGAFMRMLVGCRGASGLLA